MRNRLNALLRRLGVPGVLGIGVLLACAAFWASAVKPAQEEIAAQRLALEQLRTRSLYRPAATGGPEEQLRRFYGLFPPAERLTDEVERLHSMGRAAGLELSQGEYRLERPASGLWAYRMNLPVRGSYAQLREFLGALLNDMPIASVEALRFERKRSVETQLDAQVRVTLYVRPSAEKP